MRFIHTGDLHIGKSVNGFSMLREQAHILDLILKKIRKEKPDALLIAGDVYDKQTPSGEAVALFDNFLTRASQSGTAVLIVAGNHDSPERLSFGNRLLERSNIYIAGYEPKKVTLSDCFGSVDFFLMPFIRPSRARQMFPDEVFETFHDAVAAVIKGFGLDYSNRNILVTHQYFTAAGFVPELSESEIGPVGGLDAVDTVLVKDFDYVAAGHLHGPQKIGAAHVRYSGSPLKYSFSETRHIKSLSMAELESKGSLSLTQIPLSPLRDMRKIRGPLAELTSEAVAAMANREDFLHVTLTDDEEIFDPIGKIRSVYPNVMHLTLENSLARSGLNTESTAAAENKQPLELFEEFFIMQNGVPMSPEQAELVKELLFEELFSEREDVQE